VKKWCICEIFLGGRHLEVKGGGGENMHSVSVYYSCKGGGNGPRGKKEERGNLVGGFPHLEITKSGGGKDGGEVAREGWR